MSRKVTTPDGVEWKVGREWVPERPQLRRRGDDAFDVATHTNGPGGGRGADLGAIADDPFAAGLLVGAAIVVLLLVTTVVLPVVVLLIEVVGLLVLVGASLFGRVVLRRPWTVRAWTADGHEERFATPGFRRSGELRDGLAESLRATGRTDARLGTGAPA